jgi:hypothetical protein
MAYIFKLLHTYIPDILSIIVYDIYPYILFIFIILFYLSFYGIIMNLDIFLPIGIFICWI